MIPMNTIYNEMGIRETVLSFGKNIEKNLKNTRLLLNIRR